MRSPAGSVGWSTGRLEVLARRIDGAFPPLSEDERSTSLATFREMMAGGPAGASDVADRAGVPVARVEGLLERWPGVHRDEDGGIVGFWGLALTDTPHPFHVGSVRRYGWCAWDTLFLGELLGAELCVESSCAASGRPVRMRAGVHGVRDLDPPEAVISFVGPEHCDVDGDRVISSFCHHVLFFESKAAWRGWAPGHTPETFPLTVEEAWRLGTITNRLRYGAHLEEIA